MESSPSASLRAIYAEICRGYSEANWNNSVIFIKHLSVFEQTDIDNCYERELKRAIERGIPTESDKLKFLEKRKIWTKKDEAELFREKDYLENLRKTRAKAALKLQANQIDSQIKESQQKINKIVSKRNHLIDITAEKVAELKSQFEYIRLSFFTDRQLTIPLFNHNDINKLDDDDSNKLLELYIDCIERFKHDIVRKIAIKDFFTGSFYLCGDNIPAFFQKPMVSLTNYQVNLLNYGQYFKSIITQNDIPVEMLDDPEKLEDFVNRSKNVKNIVDKSSVSKGGRVGIVGATAEDFAALGVKDGTDEMRDVAQKQYKTGRDAAKDLGFTYTN